MHTGKSYNTYSEYPFIVITNLSERNKWIVFDTFRKIMFDHKHCYQYHEYKHSFVFVLVNELIFGELDFVKISMKFIK